MIAARFVRGRQTSALARRRKGSGKLLSINSAVQQEMTIALNSEKPVTFFRAEETEEGFLLVDRDWLVGDHPLYNATVLRPKLKVECRATGLERHPTLTWRPRSA